MGSVSRPGLATTHGVRARRDRLTNAALATSFAYPPIHKEEKESPGGEAGAQSNEKTSRGSLDAPILFQSMRRAIIRKRETRNMVNERTA
jgi:hypothetical protein